MEALRTELGQLRARMDAVKQVTSQAEKAAQDGLATYDQAFYFYVAIVFGYHVGTMLGKLRGKSFAPEARSTREVALTVDPEQLPRLLQARHAWNIFLALRDVRGVSEETQRVTQRGDATW